MYEYRDNGLVFDAIKCFRLIRNHKFGVTFCGCGYLFDKMMKSNSTSFNICILYGYFELWLSAQCV